MRTDSTSTGRTARRTHGPAMAARATTALLALVVLVALAGCRSLPLPAEFDLLPGLGEAAAGTVEAGLIAGLTTNLGLHLPNPYGACLDLDPPPAGARVENAVLHYQVEVRYDGPEVHGEVRFQPFAAANGALWEEANAVGDGVVIDLTAGTTVASDAIRMTAKQLQALNDRRVCWGIELAGERLTPDANGVATIGYRVQQLRLRVAFSLF
jgi:hypothetical protein